MRAYDKTCAAKRAATITSMFALFVALTSFVGAHVLATPALAEDSGNPQFMYRLYNPNSGEHFYTGNNYEKAVVTAAGWVYEGVGWIAPGHSNVAVHRLYNPNAGDHHYTANVTERDWLVSLGWRYEGISWYSSDTRAVSVLRQYNPHAKAGAHNYTSSVAENQALVLLGWKPEGVGWYGCNLSVLEQKDRPYLLASRALAFAKEYFATGSLLSMQDPTSVVKRPAWSVASLLYVMPASVLWNDVRAAQDPTSLSVVRNCELLSVDQNNVRIAITTASTTNPQALNWYNKTEHREYVVAFNELGLIVSCTPA